MEEPPIAGRVLKEQQAQRNHRRRATHQSVGAEQQLSGVPDQSDTEDVRRVPDPDTSMGSAMSSRPLSMPLKSRSNLGTFTSWTN
jgi:hypothetical protein